MSRKYEKLLSPVQIGRLTMKNRIFCAPSSLNCINEDCSLNEQNIAFYEEVARGGAAVVTYGEVIVHPTGQSHNRQLQVYNSERLVDLATLARAIHRHGAMVSAELSHGGKFGGLASIAGDRKKDAIAYGASNEMTPEGEVHEMPHGMVLEVCESFGKGAAMLQRAGFDMCMVHAGHGWLFSQFLSTRTNHRTDEFGGSFENRAKPLILALESIRRHCGPNFAIEVRISGDEYLEGGITLEDSIKLCHLIQDKCDLINVSAGIHEGAELFIRTHPTSYLPKAANAFLAKAIKESGVKVPISTVGAIGDPDVAEKILEAGEADVIEMRRPLLCDPELPKKLMTGKEDLIVRCLRCNGCFGESLKTDGISCVLNPVVGNEVQNRVLLATPIQEKKKVMIVGGGPGGLKAAITAAQRGHEVVLYEKADKLGGTLNIFRHVDFKYGLYEFEQVLERYLALTDAKVVLGTEVTKEIVEKEAPDVLILANGSKPIILPIPGVDGKNVILASQVFGNLDKIDDNVVIIGGGLVGCETGAYLGRNGKHVSVVEMRSEIAMDADIFAKAAVMTDMEKNGAEFFTNATASQITEEGLIVKKPDGTEELIKGGTVVMAAGFRPDPSLFIELAGSAPIVQTIGDTRKAGKVTNAVTDGYYFALDI